MYNIIEAFLQTILLFEPSTLVVPYKLKRKNKLFIFLISFIVIYVGYYITPLSSLTNLIVVPLFYVFMSTYTKKYFISFLLILFNYLFLVLFNNLIVGILLYAGIDLFKMIMAFEVCFILLYIFLTYKVGKEVKRNLILLEDLDLLSKKSKIGIFIAMNVIFIIFQVFIYRWTINYTHDIVIINTIIMSIFYIIIAIFTLFVYKKILNYEKKIDKLSYQISKLNKEQLKNIEKEILNEEENNNKSKEVLKDIIRIK